MPRVTDAEVQAIHASGQDTAPFILAAHCIINDNLLGRGLSEETLTQIELFLAAHLAVTGAAHGAGEVKKYRLGDLQIERSAQAASLGLGLDGSTFGQTARLLDSTGTLANLGRRRPVFVVV
jgi:hypothetical protein